MKTIGLLGGMSWESTATYYKLINQAVRDRVGGLASADILMRSLDFQKVVALQKADRWTDAARMLSEAAQGCDVPRIHTISETAGALKAASRRRPLLLATRYTMEHGFYARHMARHGIEVVTPCPDDRMTCHNAIFDELCQ